MSKMDICTCMVTLAGDARTVVARGVTNPMSYPEVDIMRFIHGDRAVNDVKVIKTVQTTNANELASIRLKYGAQAKEAFPGQRPRLPLEAPDDVERAYLPDVELTVDAAPEIPEVGEISPAKRRSKG